MRPPRRGTALLVLALLTGACAGGGSADPGRAGGPGPLPSPHVHGVAVDPADGAVHLATHDGLFRLQDEGGGRPTWRPVGPVIDLMGFAVAGPGHFYASGHPGPGADLPQPVGLLESTDGGETWQALSRQGESDFHALTVSDAGVLGFDGTLRSSPDGRTWQDGAIPAQPHTLSADASGATVLATTADGVLRSGDAGRTWARVPDGPLLQVVDRAPDGDTAVGVGPAGDVWSSADAGSTWRRVGQVGGRPQAVAVEAGADGADRVLVVTADALLESTDGGRSFAPLT